MFPPQIHYQRRYQTHLHLLPPILLLSLHLQQLTMGEVEREQENCNHSLGLSQTCLKEWIFQAQEGIHSHGLWQQNFEPLHYYETFVAICSNQQPEKGYPYGLLYDYQGLEMSLPELYLFQNFPKVEFGAEGQSLQVLCQMNFPLLLKKFLR